MIVRIPRAKVGHPQTPCHGSLCSCCRRCLSCPSSRCAVPDHAEARAALATAFANATLAPPAGRNDPCPCGTSGRGTGIVGYNVQAVADAKHHLIVAHDVTSHDRDQLSNMATQGHEAIGTKKTEVIADRGYYGGPEILACEEAGIKTYVPRTMTSKPKVLDSSGTIGTTCRPR